MGKSWKTTVVALVGSICIVLANQFPELKDIFTGASALAIALLGYFSKDRDVTGVH